MLEPRRIPDLDQWLDELDRLVESGASSSVFYRRTLGQLRLLLAAEGTAVVLPHNRSWRVFAFDGKIDAEVLTGLDGLDGPSSSFQTDPAPNSTAVPIRKNAPDKGWLIACFDHELPGSAATAARELMTGVAEAMAAHQRAAIEVFLDRDWRQLQSILRRLHRTESKPEAAFILVNELRSLFKAVRVALVEHADDSADKPPSNTPHVLAVSGVDQVDQHSPLVVAMKHAIAQPTSQVRTEEYEPAKHVGPHRVVIPLREAGSRDSLLIEWSDADAAMEAQPAVHQFSAAVAEAWLQQTRWLVLPSAARRYADRAVAIDTRSKRFRRWMVGLTVGVGLTVLLFWPFPFRIHANGSVQPVHQRSVFVPADGFVEEILIGDGETVVTDQVLLRVRSHTLDREWERVSGEAATLREKRNGINVALNEAASEADGSLKNSAMQAELTTELRVLDVEEAGLKVQEALLVEERERLIVRAPIAGLVVAHDLKKYLDRRPVKRGDLLFRIADLAGPWQLEMQIADRDSGYARRCFVEAHDETHQQVGHEAVIDYTLTAEPKNHRRAVLTWLAPVAYRDAEAGVVVDALASIETTNLDKRHFGGKIEATLFCGSKPFWFIWSRPLVEELQRRFWW